jgi:predicted Zn finger-like uncharacterized protein
MKITCQACHSKYNVADEKVQGKIVKIRCRKCGATIVVHGNAPATGTAPSPSEAPPAGRITAPDQAQWHVSLSDTDQRQMTLAELVSAYQAGIATQDTFLWTDGMADWKPLAEVDAVVLALNAASKGGGGPAKSAVSEAPPAARAQGEAAAAAPVNEAPVVYRQPEATAPAYRQLEAAAPVAYRAPQAAAPVTQHPVEAAAPVAYQAPQAAAPVTQHPVEAPAPVAYRAPQAAAPVAYRAPEAAVPIAASREAGVSHEADVASQLVAETRRASVVKRENRGRDLFAASPESRAIDERPAPQYPAAYAVDVGKPTGQRNENSVLFSLAMLTKTGEERAPRPESTATKDDSGMIDLKALAEKAASMRPAADGVIRAPALSTKAEVYIPPLAVSPNFGSYLGTGPARPARSRTLAIVGGGVGVVALVVFGVFLGTQIGASTAPPTVASAAVSAEASDGADAAGATAATPSASESAGEAAASAVPSSTASASVAKAAPGGWRPPPRPWGGAGAGKTGGGAAAAGGGGAAAAGGAASGAAAPAPAPKKTSDCGCNGDLMCLMKCSASGH